MQQSTPNVLLIVDKDVSFDIHMTVITFFFFYFNRFSICSLTSLFLKLLFLLEIIEFFLIFIPNLIPVCSRCLKFLFVSWENHLLPIQILSSLASHYHVPFHPLLPKQKGFLYFLCLLLHMYF